MDPRTTDSKAIPIPVDHDARNLAIVYGSLGTLIAFATLVFAVLSWMRSRHQRLAARQPFVDVELGVNPSQNTSRVPLESQTPESVSHKYASTNKRHNAHSKLTWRSYHRQTTSVLRATDTARYLTLYELEGDAPMPPHAQAATVSNTPTP
ncbi:hypothetical protein Q7P35_003734 [Cladosporium inversicolor]